MKELSIEEKAKRYDEAIEIARKINNGDGVPKHPDWTTCEVIFPELKESEDERIRKDIKRAISVALDFSYFDKETANNCLAWLKKQGERQIVHSKEDFNDGYRLGYKEARENILGPFEWCEEDENLVNEVIQLIEDGSLPKEEKEYYKERLKSLKDRCTRKPTPKLEEEDKKLLDEVIGLIEDSALSREERDSYIISLTCIKLKYY